jgi:hypothetical protein
LPNYTEDEKWVILPIEGNNMEKKGGKRVINGGGLLTDFH